jgi:nicotinamide phosphoribosyltransferase
MIFNPTNLIDAYKFGHMHQYPEGTEYVYSNFTPRGSRIEGIDKVVFLGLQAFIDELTENYQENFFDQDIDRIVQDFEQNTLEILGPNNVGSKHWRELHELGYLPLKFQALPEGYSVNLKIPMFTVENTDPRFFWLPNYIESLLSASIWLACTSATTAKRMRSLLVDWAEKTGSALEGVDFQGHDFSFRGMGSMEEAAASGAGHLASFLGSDTIIAKEWIQYHYGADEPVLLSVAATEHSVMCAGGNDEGEEQATYERLLNIYPSGIVSVVSDTWDLWNVLTVILPNLKDQIMARDGKLVIRPDSGNPVDILTGDPSAEKGTPASKGVIELLWDVFGGTENARGYKELDNHIGAIYGDSITYERADEICLRLQAKGFASGNVVFGIGSFTYRYVTRDTFGFAMKATAVTINGKERAIYKKPVTDNGEKTSARGRMVVLAEIQEGKDSSSDNVEFALIDNLTKAEQDGYGEENWMQTVWENGNWVISTTFDQVRRRVRGELN